MREIKFRAWDETIFDDTEKGRMLYMSQQYGLSPQKQIVDDCWTRFWESLARLKEYNYIIMQFTGLEDKNGKEIYEGDIIEQTFYGDDVSKMIIIVKDMVLNFQELHPGSSKENEVIGNIYENPELLEKQK